MGSSSADNIGEDAVTQVLGKDKPGRIRGMGRGVTATKLAFLHARDSHVQKLQDTQVELINKIEDLRNVVKDLAGQKNKTDYRSTSEVSDTSKGGIRCQLLDWVSNDDVVVVEGEYHSSEPYYKIGRIPLGPNAAAVVVKSVSVETASIWRPTTTCSRLAQAVGVKIAWPADKLILDDDIDLSNNGNIIGSEPTDASLGKVQIFDYWKSEDELIAKGVLLSTDPAELVNHGTIVKSDAFIWRPTPEMTKMGDALHGTIAWPIDKIVLPEQDSPKESNKISNQSGSNGSGCSSKGGKQKCALLDCNNSGQRVALGRVFSTNPTEKVHFVPLGRWGTSVEAKQ